MHFTDSDRIRILNEIASGMHTEKSAALAYGITGHSTFLKWRRKYGLEHLCSHERSSAMQRLFGNSRDEQLAIYQRRIASLEAKLERAELHVDVLETLIDISDERFGLDLRKKAGPRRSRP
jgi:transposase